jgi:hypothetical protein
MSDKRVCVVKLIDEHGVMYKVKVRAESVYEAALLGLNRLHQILFTWYEGSVAGSTLRRAVGVYRVLSMSSARTVSCPT